ncbi:SDR family oxidoreductase [Yoonia sediminilitoris]|uniref:Enoyl-ACP reductase-like protein n=1 Tax=Yoonia sediminilitoris TaxID=1286148 RepID=A0A2T6K8N6_9RHOB|nr:SDR family oxidoreductase [Yoonia sediminilitoris]PUB11085.1 enoyl-ACP reductase-like protein [Yoonia sediminilitoris]RCW91004.1 enoyl-ACP reductase-like protein [Yoonia sediminilitoris]
MTLKNKTIPTTAAGQGIGAASALACAAADAHVGATDVNGDRLAGLHDLDGLFNRTAYGATKAAVIGLTKAIAADFVAQNLLCNALCPGTINTPTLQSRITYAPDPVHAEKDFIARQPTGRLATVDDMTPTDVHLWSGGSRFVTGQAVLVDGGCTI